jgi:hypothetical protein
VVERHYDVGQNQIQVVRVCQPCADDRDFSLFKIKEVLLN